MLKVWQRSRAQQGFLRVTPLSIQKPVIAPKYLSVQNANSRAWTFGCPLVKYSNQFVFGSRSFSSQPSLDDWLKKSLGFINNSGRSANPSGLAEFARRLLAGNKSSRFYVTGLGVSLLGLFLYELGIVPFLFMFLGFYGFRQVRRALNGSHELFGDMARFGSPDVMSVYNIIRSNLDSNPKLAAYIGDIVNMSFPTRVISTSTGHISAVEMEFQVQGTRSSGIIVSVVGVEAEDRLILKKLQLRTIHGDFVDLLEKGQRSSSSRFIDVEGYEIKKP